MATIRLEDMLETSVEPKAGAYGYLMSTNDDVLAAFEDLLADLIDATTILQFVRAFRTCRESIAALIVDRAKARAILRGDDDATR